MITYFYRNKNNGFSIEKVFKTISKQIGGFGEKFTEVCMPNPGASPKDLLKNIFFAYKNKNKNGINHITGAEHYLCLILPSRNTVVTVHDVMYLSYLKGVKKIIWKYLYIQPLRLAGFVTFISEEAKNTTLKHVHLKASKIAVIPNPVSEEFIFSPTKFNDLKPIILHIGTLERKNIIRTIHALTGINCHLRIIGPLNKEIIQLLKRNQIEYSNAIMLSDAEILKEYQLCDIVNFPSVLEGFGMPIIEGQATGRIVLTSNISPMKEVANGAAILVDPFDVKSIKNGYLEIINDEGKRNEIIKKGIINAKRFHISQISKEYLSVYNSLLLK